MIKHLLKISVFFAFVLMFSSCSTRLVDFTAISSKQMNLKIDKTKGVQVEGKKGYFLGIGFNLEDALDRALENAGPGYDLMIDGVVRYTSYPFVDEVSVKGTAINTSQIKNSMGKADFKKWLKKQNVFKTKQTALAQSKVD